MIGPNLFGEEQPAVVALPFVFAVLLLMTTPFIILHKMEAEHEEVQTSR